MIEWKGYAPDLTERTPGIFVTCANVIPTLKGFAGAPSPASAVLTSAVASTVLGAKNLVKLDQSTRFFVGTSTKLYEAVSSSWTDRTRASGGDYALSATTRWRFAQYNDVSLAVAKTDLLQASSSGAFATVTGAPKAAVVETVGAFVFLFNTNEATYSDSLNRWWCSGIGDYTAWTPSVATQCATGILTATSGTITAGKRFGEAVIAYKQNSMYLGLYVGPPNIWEFRLLPEDAGALSQEAVVDVGESESPMHIFMGYDDFYAFDGSKAVPIGDQRIKETVFSELNRSKQGLVIGMHDRLRSNIYFYYPSSNNNILDKCVVYNYHTHLWGRDDQQIEFAAEYSTSGITYGDLGTYYATYGVLPDSPYESGFIPTDASVSSIFNTSNVLKTLTGASVTSSIITGAYGDDDVFSDLHRVKIRYESNPTSATMSNYYKYNSGDTWTLGATASQINARFDVLRSARWHRLKFDFTGDWEAQGMDLGAQAESHE